MLGSTHGVDLALRRVFEDLQARLASIDRKGSDEIMVVESDSELDASPAVYGSVDGRLIRITATAILRIPYRRLNPGIYT